jgi:type IV fimbrial biogenesis protein FimT
VGEKASSMNTGRSNSRRLMNPITRFESSGYTLLELIMALGILGITTGLAAPSFISMISDNRISSGASDFASAMQFSKAEAAARVNPVTICKKNTDGDGCIASGDWQQGWIVFSDLNGDAAVSAGDTILMNHDSLNSTITFGGSAGVTNSITYRPSGTTSVTSVQTLMVCDERGFDYSSLGIFVTVSGRGTVIKGSDTGYSACL